MTTDKKNLGSYGIDWNNVDLSSSYERTQNVLDNYTFNDILLEVHCNLREINADTIQKQFEENLQNRMNEAREIFNANLKNIVKVAQDERNAD